MEQLKLFDEDFEIGQFVDKLMEEEMENCGVNFYRRSVLIKFMKEQKGNHQEWTLGIHRDGSITSIRV